MILSLFSVSLFSVQAQSSTPCPANTVKQQKLIGGIVCAIKPSLTDPQIQDLSTTNKGFGFHAVAFPSNPNKIKGVFLYLMGAGSQPFNPTTNTFQATTIQQEAVANGYLVIALAYANSFDGTIGDLCAALPEPIVNCFDYGHREVIYGEDLSTVVQVAPADGVFNRFEKLNAFLKTNMPVGFPFPAGIADTTVDWSKVKVGGHSEGGGNAAILAQDFLLQQICYLGSPADYIDDSEGNYYAPPGIISPYTTPTSLMRGMVSINDGLYPPVAVNYGALNMPQSTSETQPNNNWLALTLSIPKPHTGITTDSRLSYARVWACFQDAPLVPATITAVTPLKAPVGTILTLTGTNLSSTQGVLLNGLNVPFTVISPTQITATVNSIDNTGPISVYVRTSGTITTPFTFTVSPVVTAISPVSGTVGTPVTLTGFGFLDVIKTFLNGVSVPFSIYSDTQITANITSGTNTGFVSVATSVGTANTFLGFVVMPTVVSFTPTQGPVGTPITITGSGFIGTTNVTVGTVDVSSFTVDSDTQITAIVGLDTTTGLVRVTGPAGMVSSSLTNFLVVVPPQITGFSPSEGGEGTVVTISGDSLLGTTAVLFNSFPATFTLTSATSIVAVVPAGATTGPITIVNSAGTVVSSQRFTIYPVPVVTGFTPDLGPAHTLITINGSGFQGTSSVTIGFIEVLQPTVVSDIQILAKVAPGTPSGLIRVTNPAGTGMSPEPFTVIVPPVVTTFSPTLGTEGTVVSITGSSFLTTSSVLFNGIPASFTLTSGTSMAAVVPAGATTGSISIINSAGTGIGGSFTVYPIPQITSFTPMNGAVGSVITITGSGFTGATQVTIGFIDTVFTVNSDTQITATVQVGTPTGFVRVINPVTVGASVASFGVIQPPTLEGFSPADGPAGTVVTLTGTSVGSTTAVSFSGMPTTFNILSATSITAVVPGGGTTGQITLTNPAGSVTTTDTFLVYQDPVVTSFTPTVGSVGTVVQLTGTGFIGTSALTIGGVAVSSFTVNSDTQITATVAQGSTTGLIRVTNPAGVEVSKDLFTVIQPPLIGSLNPTFGKVGDTVTITGSGFVGTTSILFNGVPTTFSLLSSTSLGALVPAQATTGPITLINPGGTTVSTESFTVYPVPSVTSFSPSSGPVGTTIQISGSGFTAVTGVTVGGVAVSSFTVNSDSQITATVATGTPTGLIRMTNPVETAASTDSFMVIQPPTLGGFSPLAGPAGTVVGLTGANLGTTSAVSFNGTPAIFTVLSGTSLTAVVPPGATTGLITVTTSAGTATTTETFLVYQIPVLQTLTPNEGPVGTVFQILGSGFTGTSRVVVNLSDVTSFTVDSDSRITATVAATTTSGTVKVSNPAGIGVSSSAFTVILPPVVGTFGPTSGAPGGVITLGGTNLGATTAVLFNKVPAAFSILSELSLRAVIPLGTSTGPISVVNPAGTIDTGEIFVVFQAPTLQSFSPSSGPVGTTIQIMGTGFIGTTGVTMGGVPIGNFTVVSDTQITATVATGTTTGVIRVTNPAGLAVSGTSFTVIQPPALGGGFSPMAGPVGTVVTLTGGNLGTTTAVSFNGVAAIFTVVSGNSITAVVPMGATTGPVTATNPAGSVSTTTSFNVILAPTLTSFSPGFGKVGDTVSLTGINFLGSTAVFFNGVPTTFSVLSGTSLGAVVPSGATTGAITVVNPGGIAVSVDSFTVYPVPAVTSFTPSSGPVGTTIQISGSGFTAVTGVTVGGVAVSSFTVNSDTQITATVAMGTPSGPIKVTNPVGTGTSDTSFTVVQPPTLGGGFSPIAGPVGTVVTLTGGNLGTTTAVSFNGVTAIFTVVSGNSITAVVPTGATTGLITLTNPAGSVTSTVNFMVILAPTLSSFSPGAGSVGTVVTLTGTNLNATSAVSFNGVAATFTVQSATRIQATVPAGATAGSITVSNPGGTAISATAFTVR